MAMIDHHGRLGLLRRERVTYEGLVADLPARKAAIAAIDTSGAAGALFPAQSPDALAGQIERSVSQAVLEAGASVTRNTIRVESSTDTLVTSVSDHVMFRCDIAQLTRVLFKIRQDRPSLFVRHLGIEDVEGEDRSRGPHRLSVDLVVAGYLRPRS